MTKQTDISRLFEEPAASELEQRRHQARGKRRIIYDCFNAHARGEKVLCTRGYPLGTKTRNWRSLLVVLRGQSTALCSNSCPDYDDGGEPYD